MKTRSTSTDGKSRRPAKAATRQPTQSWAPERRGKLSSMDYAQMGALDGIDPYFVWADLSGFAHLRSARQDPAGGAHLPQRLPVLIEFARGATPAQLLQALNPPLQAQGHSAKASQRRAPAAAAVIDINTAYLSEQGLQDNRVFPANVQAGFFAALRQQPRAASLVRRLELDAPYGLPEPAQPLAYAPAVARLTGKIFAFIDDGCAFAHPHFVQAGHTRVQRLWDQNERAPGAAQLPPQGFGYGRAFTGAELDALMQDPAHQGDEDAIYSRFAAGTLGHENRLHRSTAHGAHVMDLACGPYYLADTMPTRTGAPAANPNWEKAQDAASQAAIVFVQLPLPTVQDTSGRGAMTANVLDGINYILAQCSANAEIVLNLSWGILAGPHDGSAALERALDALVLAQGGRLQVVMPAGNGYQSRTHANFKLAPGASRTLPWRVLPDDHTESFLELWMPASADLAIELTLPDGSSLAPVNRGSAQHYIPAGGVTSVAGVVYPLQPTQGQNGQMALLTLAPTASWDNSRTTAACGMWQVRVTNTGSASAVVDAYIERDDVALNTRRGARQSFFDDPDYQRFALHDSGASVVRREGVFNAIGTGRNVVVAGGLRESDLAYAEYSPTGVYSARPARPGTRRAVDLFAVTEESPTLHGVRAAGTRGGATVRLSGTSMAAPQIARDLFNAL